MVTEWFAAAMTDLWVWFVGSIPAPEPPDFFAASAAGISQVGGYLSYFDPWAPVWLIAPIVGLWAVTFLLGIGLKLARMLVSFFSFGGGAA